MKYAKPKSFADPRADDRAILKFLDSLPDEFEIVEPGMVQVKWPEGCTRAALESDAKYIYYRLDTESSTKVEVHLKALAAIAPTEKKKRKVWLWEKDHPHYTERSWTSNDIDRSGGGWRKVGECEVDA